jgi:hypothetical protein
VEHLLKEVAPVIASAVRLERDVRHGVIVHGGLEVGAAQIRLVGAHLAHGEVLRGRLD